MSKPRTHLNAALLTITLGCTATQAKLVADEIERLESENELLTEKAERLRDLVTEVMNWHANPESPDYNQCQQSPCQWCVNAKQVLEETAQ